MLGALSGPLYLIKQQIVHLELITNASNERLRKIISAKGIGPIPIVLHKLMSEPAEVPEVMEFPLFFDPTGPMTEINYMRDVRHGDWDIGKLEPALYLYQPDVEPSPEGGHVKVETPQRKKPGRSEFFEVKKSQQLKPEDQPWILVTKDKRTWRGTRDTLSNCAAMYHGEDGAFHISLIDESIRMFEEHHSKDIRDADTAIQKMDDDRRMQNTKRPRFLHDLVQESMKQRNERRKRIKEELLDEGSDPEAGGDEGSEKEGEIDFPEKEEFDDDEGIEGAPDEDMDDIFEWSDLDDEDDFLSDDEEEDADRDAGKRKKRQTVSQVIVEAKPGDEPPMTAEERNKKIVTDILGKEEVKEAEFRRYVMDIGMVTFADLKKKFKPKLETLAQKEAFQNLIRKLLIKEQKGNIQYLRLRRATAGRSKP
jgi:hypothetical protein